MKPATRKKTAQTLAAANEPRTASSTAVVTLSHKHYARLRSYFREQRIPSQYVDAIDIELAAAGLIAGTESAGQRWASFPLTRAGILELHAEYLRELERRRGHHALGEQLAAWLRQQGRITWENIQLDTRADLCLPVGRPDVFSIKATRNPAKSAPQIHEVKVSRADFLADIAKPEKRLGYHAVAEQVFYATPAGMVQPDEVPDACGLVWATAAGDDFTVVKEAVSAKVKLTERDLMTLILKGGTVNPMGSIRTEPSFRSIAEDLCQHPAVAGQ